MSAVNPNLASQCSYSKDKDNEDVLFDLNFNIHPQINKAEEQIHARTHREK